MKALWMAQAVRRGYERSSRTGFKRAGRDEVNLDDVEKISI
jgi:hypothetical protein